VAIVHENQAEKKVIGGVGSKNIQKEIRTEMAVFEQQIVKGPNLSKCYKYLKSIPSIPLTSVESERCFSASGNIVTKLRSSMNDDTLDAISFLRSHFINTDTEQQQKK
jgi:hAT family C-terminal dimerisation region